MLGAIIGDIAGSRFEFDNIKSKEFQLFHPKCEPTDDSIMSLAVAQAILDCGGDYDDLSAAAVRRMRQLGRSYPHAGYGGRFRVWLRAEEPEPYYSCGNGSAMRVSPCGFAAETLEQAIELADKVTCVTHDHPEGMKGAEAVAATIFLARQGKTMAELRAFVTEHYYPIDFTLDEIRPTYTFYETCQDSVPQAFEAFFESTDFEDAIRSAISIGGDSDTIAAIAGSMAEAYYGIPAEIEKQALEFLDNQQRKILDAYRKVFPTT